MTLVDDAIGLASGPLGAAKTLWKNKKGVIIACLIAAAIAVGGFLYWQNGNLFDEVVDAKTENHDQKATIQSFETKDKTNEANAKIDDAFEQRQTITQKEYVHVRTIIHDAPVESRTRQADPLIIDTLNGLERMSRGGETTSDRVPDSDDPVG